MNQKPLYRTFQNFLSEHFSGKIQKISINAGFTCPNRDGSKGYGGCTYCNNQTFHPAYCSTEKSVSTQLREGMVFFGRKYPTMDYLAYFQAYTNTYAALDKLVALYEEALNVPGVKGLVIGTRPDCMPDPLLDYFSELSRTHFILIEYGVESTKDETLRFINRGHDFACSADAIRRTAARNLLVGAHLILGLPGENRSDIREHALKMSQLPLNTIKLHQLQIIRHTKLAAQVEAQPGLIGELTPNDYVEMVVDFLEYLRADIAVERFVSQSPPELLLAPDWGLKNYQFTPLVEKELIHRGTRQGSKIEG